MKENKRDKPVADNRKEDQRQDYKKADKKSDTTPGKAHTMIENAQSEAPKEQEEEGHKHDSKTPVGDRNNKPKIKVQLKTQWNPENGKTDFNLSKN